jgi:hypothetical protein
LELYLCALIHTENLLWTTSGEIIGSISCLGFLTIFSIFPIATYCVVVAKKKSLLKARFMDLFGEMYEGLDKKRG